MPIERTTTQEEAAHRLNGASPPDPQNEFQREYLLQQQRYDDLRFKASVALIVVCPALALLPPRKIDWFTFGLGSAWLFGLNNVSSAYGREMWRGFRRKEDIAFKMAQKPEVEGVKVGGWKGEKIIKDYRKREQEADSYKGIIMEQIWDVLEQRDRNKADKNTRPEGNAREEKED